MDDISVSYLLFEEDAFQEEIGHYQTYGIQIKSRTPSDKKDRTLHDVTSNKDEAHQLVELLNRLQVSPTHLDDVLDDLLGSTEQ